MEINEKDIKRFWSKVDVGDPDECWEWLPSKESRYYGSFKTGTNRTSWKPHRFSWKINRGIIPEGLCVCHHCDNPPCVNPNHLFVGTHKDNMQDASAKGRLVDNGPAEGEENPAAKLTKNKVDALRGDYCKGMTYKQLKAKYNVADVSNIVRNISYHDPDYEPINGNAKSRPWRKMFSKSEAKEIRKVYTVVGSSRKVAKVYNTNKRTIMIIAKGEY